MYLTKDIRRILQTQEPCFGVCHYPDARFGMPAYEVLKITPDGGVFRRQAAECEKHNQEWYG